MQKDYAIEVINVKKKFKSYADKASSLKERFLRPNSRRHEEFWVLNGLNFVVKKGEAIGIIGKNGSGKSTTLKLLTRILSPNEGTIEIKGRVSSLIELGAGFHPDMTGRENIYTNASIFGITKKEVDKRLNDIIRFSELEDYIDNPVRTYSSGMYMRLAFAVAINVDADVLLIDEILAVGDSAFQKKCFEKLKEIKSNGTTIVIVSHSMDQMYKICDSLIWIENGLIKEKGVPKFIGEAYLASMEGKRLNRIDYENRQKKEELDKRILLEKERIKLEQEKESKNREEKRKKELEEQQKLKELEEMQRMRDEIAKNETLKKICKFCKSDARRSGNGEIHYTRVALINSGGKESNSLITLEKCKIELEYESEKEEIFTKFVIGITRVDGVYCYGTSVNMNANKKTKLSKKGKIIFEFQNKLLKGKYVLDLWIETAEGYQFDSVYSLMEFEVNTMPYTERGLFTMDHRWQVDGVEYEF